MWTLFTLQTPSVETTHDLYWHFRIKSASPAVLSALSLRFQAFSGYRNLHFGMNQTTLEALKQRKNVLLANRDPETLPAFKKIVQTLGSSRQRYDWDRQCFAYLSQENVWAAKPLSKLKAQWERVVPYAYYRSEDLAYLSRNFFPRIEKFIQRARRDLSKLYRPKKYDKQTVDLQKKIDCFKEFIDVLEKRFKKERRYIARAMLVRLQLAEKHNDLQYDDVLHDFSETLQEKGFQPEQIDTLGKRPYQTPRARLPQNLHKKATKKNSVGDTFRCFHTFIQHHGGSRARAQLQKLTWVQKAYYVYNTRRKSWGTNPALFEKADIPRSKRHPNWLFRGRNARYCAFGDASTYIQMQLRHASVFALGHRVDNGSVDGWEDSRVLETLEQHFQAIKKEQERITGLKKGLLRVLHAKSRRVLNGYLADLNITKEAVIGLQLRIVEIASASLDTIVQLDAQCDSLIDRSDRIARVVEALPEEHALVLKSKTLQTELRKAITRHKLNAFALQMRALPFRKRARYAAGGVRYKVADAQEVNAYFTRLTRHMTPQASQAMGLVASLLKGDYYTRAGAVLTYHDLVTALQPCFDDPDSLVRVMIEKIIAPAIYTTHSAGYTLLRDCEENIEDHSRSDLLQTLQQQQKEALYVAIEQVLENRTDLKAQTEIRVGQYSIPMAVFLTRVSILEKPARDALAEKYLKTFQGEDENLWSLFNVFSKAHAGAYAAKRLSYLLEKRDGPSILESDCLWGMQVVLEEDRGRLNALLARFVSTVPLDLRTLPTLQKVVTRFAKHSLQLAWRERCEQFLLEQFTALLYTDDRLSIVRFINAIRKDHVFPTVLSVKASLAVRLPYVPHDTWTEDHHALVDSLQDTDLKQVYYMRLLRRLFADREFAQVLAQHIPTPQKDLPACQTLIAAPGFKAVCEAGIQGFLEQPWIDNVAGLRVLQNLLHSSMTCFFDMEDLQKNMDILSKKFQVQCEIEYTVKEITTLIDVPKDRAIAKRKLIRLRQDWAYYKALPDQVVEYDKRNIAIRLVVDAIRRRVERHWEKDGVLDISSAIALLDALPDLPLVVRFRESLTTQRTLLASRLEMEIFAVASGKTTRIPSLSLLLSASKNRTSLLQEKETQRLLEVLQHTTESDCFETLSQEAQSLLGALWRMLKNASRVEDRSIFLGQRQPKENPSVSPVVLLERNSLGTAFNLTGLVTQGISREIIKDLQTADLEKISFHTVTIDLLKSVFLPKGKDAAHKEAVAKDLLRVFNVLYFAIAKQENTREKKGQAVRILNKMQCSMDALSTLPDFPFVILTKQWQRIGSTLDQALGSFQKIFKGTQHDFPQLNGFLLAIIEGNLLPNTTKADWAKFLREKVLPSIRRESFSGRPELSAALTALLRVLTQHGTQEDRQCIMAYGKRSAEVSVTRVRNTQRVRMIGSPPPRTSVPTIVELAEYSNTTTTTL